MTLPPSVARALADTGLDPVYVETVVTGALDEDRGDRGDVTSDATVPAEQTARALIASRAEGVIAGIPVIAAVFAAVAGEDVIVTPYMADGDIARAGSTLVEVSGNTRHILRAERVALNFASHLSGIATATRAWADALANTSAVVRDTRKTSPLLRGLEKYAVRVGGGVNHRSTLSESALIKDNHIVAAGGITAAYLAVKKRFPDIEVEVEVDDVEGAGEAADAGAELILLDNFTLDEVRKAVDVVAGRARLEVSGGLTLSQAEQFGAAGVDYLAVGSLTHSVRALDLGLDMLTTDGPA